MLATKNISEITYFASSGEQNLNLINVVKLISNNRNNMQATFLQI